MPWRLVITDMRPDDTIVVWRGEEVKKFLAADNLEAYGTPRAWTDEDAAPFLKTYETVAEVDAAWAACLMPFRIDVEEVK